MPATDSALLCAQNLTLRFGGLVAVADFSLSLRRRELVGLIGPNGAGKTTVFNVMTGVYAPTQGELRLDDAPLLGRPHEIAYRGLARTFQNIRVFRDMTVLDNVRVACHMRARAGLWQTLLATPAAQMEERDQEERAKELLKALGLEAKAQEEARALAYGDQRRLEIARALATRPKVLLLDEPAAGMNAQETVELMRLIRELRDRFDLAVLLIEHDMRLVMGICERLLVLDHGVTIASGTPQEIQRNPKVIEAYLGEKYARAHAETATGTGSGAGSS